jgi:hypothetical protein
MLGYMVVMVCAVPSVPLLHLQYCYIWRTCNSLFLQHVLGLCCESLGNAYHQLMLKAVLGMHGQ